MKTPLLFHALWAFTAVVAFLAGRIANDPPPQATVPETNASATKPAGSTSNGTQAATDGARHSPALPADAPLTPEEARVQTFELLSVPGRLERLTRLCEMLRRMTKENWRDINLAFAKQTEFTGRTHPAEWQLMLERVGEVAGVQALEETLADGTKRSRLPSLAAGWAAADPQSAMEWLEAQPPERQQELAGDFVNGLARTDPVGALTYLGTRVPDARDQWMPGVVHSLIQHGGFQHAEEMLTALRTRADIPSPVIGAYYSNLTQRQIQRARIRNDPRSVLAWADSTAGPGLPGPGALKDMVTYAAESDVPSTFDWVIERSASWNPDQISRVFPVIAGAYQEQAPEKLAAWIDSHPDHPQRDVVVAGVAQSIVRSGDYDAALRWAQTLPSGGTRTNLEAEIATRREKATLANPPR